MNAWKNWSAAILCGAAVLSVAIVPHRKIESESEALMSTGASSAQIQSLEKPKSQAGEELREFARLRKNQVVDQWLNAMRTDAFGDQLIFSQLSTFEPVTNIMKKGIVSFDRKTLRTQNYRDEEGYDLLVYEIHHPLSVESRVMAYYEKRTGELPILKIVFLTGRPAASNVELVQFENGSLSGHREVAWSEGQTLFDRQLTDASTLMSASIH